MINKMINKMLDLVNTIEATDVYADRLITDMKELRTDIRKSNDDDLGEGGLLFIYDKLTSLYAKIEDLTIAIEDMYAYINLTIVIEDMHAHIDDPK